MTTLEDRPGQVVWTGPAFEYDLDDLAEVGVRLHPKQLELLHRAMEHPEEVFTAMVAKPVYSPTGYRFRMEPLEFLEPSGEVSYAWHPAPVQVCFAVAFTARQNFDANEPAWRRFPTLPGRTCEVDPWSVECEWGDWEGFRIWDLWPLPEPAIEFSEQVLVPCVAEWLEDQAMRYWEWLNVDRGEIDFCDYASVMGGGDPENHEHVGQDGLLVAPEDHDATGYYSCKTGEEFFWKELGEMLAPNNPEGESYLAPWESVPLPQPFIDEDWRPLLTSSRRNATAALQAFPPWDRDQILTRERNYSPWLLLS